MKPPSTSLDRVERLVHATPELVGELRLDRVLQRVADLARDVLGARYAAIGLLNPDNQSLESFTTSGLSPEQRARLQHPPTGRGVLGLVIHQGQVVRLRDLRNHPAAAGFPPHHPEMRSFLGVPIVGRRGVVGDLYLTEKTGAEEFSEDDVHVAVLLATIVGSAVENARSHEHTAQLLEEIQELQRSRERFFAMVNHELRNALAAVYGWAEMLVRKKDPQTVPRGAFEILESAEQAVALINDLLDLSRLDEDRLRPVIRDVDCCTLVRNSIQRVTPAAEEKQVRLSGPGGERPLLCRTDGNRVEQIFVNLLTNAIRHTPPGSRVVVDARPDPPHVEFTVRDEGPGVGAEDVDRIFDIYHTMGGPDGRNAGVGLPLSRRLARLLGGDLYAVPTAGRGGLFVLRVPAAPS
jgi:signal transduction histidine kinase